MPLRRSATVLLAAASLGAASLAAAPTASAVATPVALHVDASLLGPAIDPAVYGASFPSAEFAAAARPGLWRWGGNATSRYDYATDRTNRGSDWFFENDDFDGNPAGSTSVDLLASGATLAGAESAITVPANGWVAKDASSCGFPTSTYAGQDATDVYRPTCGNGEHLNGPIAVTLPESQTSKAFSHADQTAMVQHLGGSLAQAPRRPLYLLDNEPSLWSSTHRDVHPTAVSGSDLFALSTASADAIKDGDATALVAGPGDWGFCALYWFPADNCAPGADRVANGGADFVPAYLSAFKAHDDLVGHRTLDVLDEHFYPQGTGVYDPTSAGNAGTQALRLRSTRALWDPTYTDESWIGSTSHPVVQLIPQLKSWIATYYPGTAVGIGEYGFGATDTMNGALAQADALGILGREGVRYAALWGAPSSATSPTTYAFRMFRNLDGAGAGFGSRSVHASSDDQDTVSVYAATRADGTLTVVLVNKAMSGSSYLESPVTLDLAGFAAPPLATAYTYSVADPTASLPAGGIVASTLAPSVSGPTPLTLPAASITTLVLPKRSTATLTASRTTLVYPTAVALTARLSQGGLPVVGAPVRLYARPVGTTRWSAGTTVTTDAFGRAIWSLRPSYSTEYAALDLRSATATSAPAALSPVARVKVARAVSLAVSATSVRLGTTVRFSGKVSPAGPAHKLVLQRRIGTTWRTVASTYTTSTSTWSISLRQSARGTWAYRAVVAGDALHLQGVSAARAVKVV